MLKSSFVCFLSFPRRWGSLSSGCSGSSMVSFIDRVKPRDWTLRLWARSGLSGWSKNSNQPQATPQYLHSLQLISDSLAAYGLPQPTVRAEMEICIRSSRWCYYWSAKGKHKFRSQEFPNECIKLSAFGGLDGVVVVTVRINCCPWDKSRLLLQIEFIDCIARPELYLCDVSLMLIQRTRLSFSEQTLWVSHTTPESNSFLLTMAPWWFNILPLRFDWNKPLYLECEISQVTGVQCRQPKGLLIYEWLFILSIIKLHHTLC